MTALEKSGEMAANELLKRNGSEYPQMLSTGRNSVGGTSDDSDNNIDGGSYSNKGLKDQIMKLIETIMAALKSGRDVSADINKVMGLMQKYCSNVVGQDSEAQTQMTKYLSGVANIQKYTNDKDGKPVQDIDPYSGKPELNSNGTEKMVSPEEALQHQLQYLVNNPKTKYEVEDDGTGHPKLVQPKKINPAYKFFNKHPDLYDSMKSNITNLLSSMKNPDGTSPSLDNNTEGYNILPDGSINPGANITKGSFPYDNKPNQDSYPGGAIEYMWKEADKPIDPSTGEKPDPAILNQVMSAIGSINQSYTSASSALQTVGKTDEQDFNAAQGNMNKFLQSMVNINKTMVQAQRTG